MNKNKSLPFIVGAIIIIVAFVLVFVSKSNNKKIYTPPSTTTNTTTQTSTPSPAKPSTTTKTPITTTKNPGEYTLAEVATHNSGSSCWTTINGGVYDVTSWINQHPGGSEAILSLCGIDGSAAFNGQHGGQARPASELASFKIGTLKK